MKKRAYFHCFAFFGLAILLAALTGCGGGGSSSPPPAGPSPPPLSITTSSLPNGINGQAYNQTLQATGGTPPYTWSLSSGSLPSGLNLVSGDTISGTPTQVGDFGFTIQVQDSASRTAPRTLTLRVVLELTILTTTLSNGNVGVEYIDTLHFTGGGGPSRTWSIISGNLPDGLSLNSSNGEIRGTPTVPGTFAFTVQLSDSGSPQQTTTGDINILIENKIVVPLVNGFLPLGVVQQPYDETIPVVGGIPPFTFSIIHGRLPAGLNLDPSTGVVSGIPTEVASLDFVLEITDSTSPPQVETFFMQIAINPQLQFITHNLPDGAATVPYSGFLDVAGGRPPYAARVVAGTLPNDVHFLEDTSLSGVFLLVGTPMTIGIFSFRIEVDDTSSPADTIAKDFTIRVNEKLEMITDSIPEGVVGIPYNFTLQAKGGLPPLTWFIQNCPGPGCRVPPGLNFDPSTGEISGTPTAPYQDTPIVGVSDSSSPPQSVHRDLTFAIYDVLKVATTQVPRARIDSPFRIQVAATGGKPPFTWSITSGALPVGLMLHPTTGEISGTPTALETQVFTLQVEDSGTGSVHQLDEQALTLSVVASLGRNDSIGAATSLSNGKYLTSISPYADPADTASPDSDYYEITADAGAIVTVETLAERLVPTSQLDSVVEIVDANGVRLNTCRDPGDNFFFGPVTGDSTPFDFDDACIDDDLDLTTLDSRLELMVSGQLGTLVTFYVHVLDFRGDARPDFPYEIKISGAN